VNGLVPCNAGGTGACLARTSPPLPDMGLALHNVLVARRVQPSGEERPMVADNGDRGIGGPDDSATEDGRHIGDYRRTQTA
jgi:hypothetical protein